MQAKMRKDPHFSPHLFPHNTIEDIIDNVNIICFNRSFKGKNPHKDQDDFNNISFVSDFAIDISFLNL